MARKIRREVADLIEQYRRGSAAARSQLIAMIPDELARRHIEHGLSHHEFARLSKDVECKEKIQGIGRTQGKPSQKATGRSASIHSARAKRPKAGKVPPRSVVKKIVVGESKKRESRSGVFGGFTLDEPRVPRSDITWATSKKRRP